MGITKSVNNDANLSDLALANVEALADSESGGGEDTTIVSKVQKVVMGHESFGAVHVRIPK